MAKARKLWHELKSKLSLGERAAALRASAQRARKSEAPIWISVIEEEALETEIGKLAQREQDGDELPLLGLSFAVKDNIDVEGFATTAACPSFSRRPRSDAPVVARLRAAGAVVLGKTNMDQFATGLVGTRSPFGAPSSVYSKSHISGGSSSGSAVAVALGQVCFSLGTDTAGSGRVPAAFNGLVGCKPSKGLLSTRGVVPACRSLDCVSIFTPQVEEAAQIFAIARGFDKEDPFSRRGASVDSAKASQLTLGTPSADKLEFFGDVEASQLHSQAWARLQGCASGTVEIDYTPFSESALLLYGGAWVAERYLAVGKHLEEHPDDSDPIVRKIILGGREPSATDAFAGMTRLAELKRSTEEAWEKMDVLVLPTTPTAYSFEEVAADPILTNSRLGTYTNFVNLLDLCALALPAGRRKDGASLGVTLIAPAFCEDSLFALGSRYLQTLNSY